MPWSDYHPDVRQFTGLIQAAANERFGSAATVEIIAAAARAASISLPFQAFSSVARMYGTYVGVRESSARLATAQAEVIRSGLDLGITSDLISKAPYSPSDDVLSLNPYLLVKGQYTMETPAGTETGYFSHRYRLSELHTVGQVEADLQAQMNLSTQSPDLSEAELTGLSSIEWSH